MMDSSVVGDSMMSNRQLRHVENMNTDKIGVLKSRKGYTQLGDAAVVTDNVGLGLHNHVSSTAANSQIVAFINNAGDTNAEAYYLSGTTWTNKALAFTADTKIRTVTFLDYLIAVNGADSPKSWTGATGDAWGTTNLVSAPAGALVETYKQQVFIGNESTDQVDFSSVPTGGAITWTAADNFIVNPNDGSNLTALKRFAGQLLICKSDYIYRFNGRSIDPDPVIFYGVSSQEAITVTKSKCFFYDGRRNAIVAYQGGFPQEISKPVRAFLEAVPTSFYSSVAVRSDEDHVETFIGNVTVDGIAYTDCALRYTISTQTWTARTYANTFNVFTHYDDGTNLLKLGFADNGTVYKMDNGTTDDGTAISFGFETRWITFGSNPANQLTLAAFSAYADPPLGTNVQLMTERDKTWRPIGKMHKYVTSWSGINADFHKIRFRFRGSSSNAQVEIEGFSLQIPIFEEKEKSSTKLQ